MHELDLFREVDFDNVKIAVKASNVPLMIDAYRLLSETTDHPLHLGVTEAGPPPQGLIKSVAGIGTLLAEGIGDTIRFSLTADPVEEAERIMEEGVEARIAAADAGAEAEAAATRDELLQIQGTDANHVGDKLARIHEIS